MKVIDISACNLQMKEKYIKMFRAKNFYYRANVARNKLIARLEILFNEAGPGVKWLLGELLKPDSRGIRGDLMGISINKNKVFIEPSDIMKSRIEDDPEDAPIEVDRDVLIRLTTNWQELVQKGVPEIFIYQKDGEYFVADTLPEDVK